MSFKHVIGMDLSLTATAIVDHDEMRVYGGDSRYGDGRLETIYAATHHHIRRAPVDPADILIMMEDLPTHAKGAGITGMVHGVVRLAVVQARVGGLVRVVASSLKAYATGSGSASKPDMRMELYKRTGLDISDDNKVDAWWLRQAGLDAIGHPDAIVLPKAHRQRMQRWHWPRGVTLGL